MVAHIENGGIDTSIITQVGDSLKFFNRILDVVHKCDDSEELSIELTGLFLRARKSLLRNPFSFGFIEGGLELYQDDNPNRILFVPCETDVDIL